MPLPRLSKLELQIKNGRALEAGDALDSGDPGIVSGARRPAYTTIQTTVYRMEEKGALRRVKKISNAHIFEAVVSRKPRAGG